ncbi:hypothetical protein MMC25_004613 [Agyrium rufum]|nr:hypothetical protein [Agyrium rufum]
MASKSFTRNDYTVRWICALPTEQTASIVMLDERHPDLPNPPNDHNTYSLGSISSRNIVIACLLKGRVGNNSSATVASQMLSTFPSVKFGLMVGIGGAVPPNKVRLGDIVVSAPVGGNLGVVQWDFGKTEQGGVFRRTGLLNNPPSILLTALTKLETEHEITGSKIPTILDGIGKRYPRIVHRYLNRDHLTDLSFLPDYCHRFSKDDTSSESEFRKRKTRSWEGVNEEEEEDEDDDEIKSCRFCDLSKAISRKPQEVQIHYGLIASGNQVIKDSLLREHIDEKLNGQVLCFEMEAAGLMNNFTCLIIRGICNYADSHKNMAWQAHAAISSAAFARSFSR